MQNLWKKKKLQKNFFFAFHLIYYKLGTTMCEDDEGTKQFLEPYRRRFYLLKNKGIEWMKYGHTLFFSATLSSKNLVPKSMSKLLLVKKKFLVQNVNKSWAKWFRRKCFKLQYEVVVQWPTFPHAFWCNRARVHCAQCSNVTFKDITQNRYILLFP